MSELKSMSIYNEYNIQRILELCKNPKMRDDLIRWSILNGHEGDKFTLYRIMLDYPEYFDKKKTDKYFIFVLTSNPDETKFLVPLLYRADITLDQKKLINRNIANGKNLRDNVKAAEYFSSKGFELFCGKSEDFALIRRECLDRHAKVITDSKKDFYKQEFDENVSGYTRREW